MSFDTLGLSPAILRALTELGHDTPTPIQTSAIPLVLEGHDLLAAAQTGTGKTGGFALPVLERLFPAGKRDSALQRNPRVLILTPTRELAAQVHESLRAYGKYLGVRSTTIFGGVGMQPQVDAVRRGLDVLIATPGRLIDHMERRTVDLSGVQCLVLDEADRMLDMGFMPALKRILAVLPKQHRQTLMFSATFSDEIKKLAAQFLRDPREVQVTPRNTVAANITHLVHPVDASRKRDLLVDVLAKDSRRQTLVFSRTKHGADKLTTVLSVGGFKAAAIHGNKSQGARTKALADFKSGRITILVATDIAARGLDIPQLPVVVNFDLPMVAEDYVHRIGRTGRAGEDGQAISLVSQDEAHLLRDIQRLLKQEIRIENFPGFTPNQPLRVDTATKPPSANKGRPAQHARRGHVDNKSSKPGGHAKSSHSSKSQGQRRTFSARA
jgi:ATP-dependent RNA helicase RhlE